jgi:hypothetical protein
MIVASPCRIRSIRDSPRPVILDDKSFSIRFTSDHLPCVSAVFRGLWPPKPLVQHGAGVRERRRSKTTPRRVQSNPFSSGNRAAASDEKAQATQDSPTERRKEVCHNRSWTMHRWEYSGRFLPDAVEHIGWLLRWIRDNYPRPKAEKDCKGQQQEDAEDFGDVMSLAFLWKDENTEQEEGAA